MLKDNKGTNRVTHLLYYSICNKHLHVLCNMWHNVLDIVYNVLDNNYLQVVKLHFAICSVTWINKRYVKKSYTCILDYCKNHFDSFTFYYILIIFQINQNPKLQMPFGLNFASKLSFCPPNVQVQVYALPVKLFLPYGHFSEEVGAPKMRLWLWNSTCSELKKTWTFYGARLPGTDIQQNIILIFKS